MARRDVAAVRAAAADAGAWRALWDIVGASDGFAEFYLRHPDELVHLSGAGLTLPDEPTMRTELLASVGDDEGFAADATDAAWVSLRVRYRRLLARIAAYDLGQDDPAGAIDVVSSSLADLAGAALEASLSVARSRVSGAGPGAFPRAQVEATRFAIIAMGKTGARELNYVSDVDVIFVGGSATRRSCERGACDRHRHTTRGADDARHRRARDRTAALGGRPQPAPGRQAGRAGAQSRLAPAVLRALGEELGVPGAAQGARDRG